MNAGSSPIPSRSFLQELEDDEFRDGFVADHVHTRLALLIRTLREQRGWSQADLARVMGTTQSVVSRLEDPDYGKLSSQTLFKVASAFKLPVYIDMPNWEEWFRLMEDMSIRNLARQSFNVIYLSSLAHEDNWLPLTINTADGTNITNDIIAPDNSVKNNNVLMGYTSTPLSGSNLYPLPYSSATLDERQSGGMIPFQPSTAWEIAATRAQAYSNQMTLIGQRVGLTP